MIAKIPTRMHCTLTVAGQVNSRSQGCGERPTATGRPLVANLAVAAGRGLRRDRVLLPLEATLWLLAADCMGQAMAAPEASRNAAVTTSVAMRISTFPRSVCRNDTDIAPAIGKGCPFTSLLPSPARRGKGVARRLAR